MSNIEVHDKPFAAGLVKDSEENLITLCVGCHEEMHISSGRVVFYTIRRILLGGKRNPRGGFDTVKFTYYIFLTSSGFPAIKNSSF